MAYKKVLAEKENSNNIYDNKFVLLISIAVLVLSIFMVTVYNYYAVRYAIFALVLVVIWIKRESLRNWLKLLKSKK